MMEDNENSVDEAKAALLKKIEQTLKTHEKFARISDIFLAIVGVLVGVAVNLITANTSKLNYLTLALVVGGFTITLVAFILVARKLSSPAPKITRLAERIKAIYIEALDKSLLNPQEGGNNA